MSRFATYKIIKIIKRRETDFLYKNYKLDPAHYFSWQTIAPQIWGGKLEKPTSCTRFVDSFSSRLELLKIARCYLLIQLSAPTFVTTVCKRPLPPNLQQSLVVRGSITAHSITPAITTYALFYEIPLNWANGSQRLVDRSSPTLWHVVGRPSVRNKFVLDFRFVASSWNTIEESARPIGSFFTFRPLKTFWGPISKI